MLMTAALPGQRRPGLAEAADLIVSALRVRCQPARTGEPGWRRALAVAAAAALAGLVAGIVFAALNPPPRSSTESVFLTSGIPGARAQAAAATSRAVLQRAARSLGPASAPQALRREVAVSAVTSQVLQFTAQANTAPQAMREVSAVAASYLADVNLRTTAGPRSRAVILQPPAVMPETSRLADILATGGIGALCGALIGAFAGLASSRPPRHLRLT